MNKVWENFAYHRRLEYALDDQPIPNRRFLREQVRRGPAGLRRAIFGAWRSRRG